MSNPSARALPVPRPGGSLLLLSLGPIQDFIASARRCQDLWFGSWLLSDLARVTAAHIRGVGDRAVTIIFPAGLATQGAQADNPGISNLILARLAPGLDAAALAEGAEAAMKARLVTLARRAWQGAAALEDEVEDGALHEGVALQQLEELMEVLWVQEPLADEADSTYDAARQQATRRLGALKNTRAWRQPAWTAARGRGVPKSSLDGDRESVIDESVYDRRSPRWLSPEARRRRFGTKGAERLCGVGLLKRLGVELPDSPGTFDGARPPFHSTPHVAMAPLLRAIEARGDEGAAATRRYLDRLRALDLPIDDRFRLRKAERSGEGGPATLGGFDGALLLRSRLRDHFEEHRPGFTSLNPDRQRGELRSAEAALSELLQDGDHPAEPCPYYAFLLADGDNMGAAIDGLQTVEGHQALSAALNHFALQCRDIVARHEGSLVFAGGDDVLALLPLHRALDCARALSAAFAGLIQPAVEAAWPPGGEPARPTLSVGLAITHCREPMSDARRLAKRAEALAKAQPGKDSLGLIVSKRGGADLSLCGGWTEEARAPLDQRLQFWIALEEAGALSNKTAHDLEAVAAHYAILSRQEQAARSAEICALVLQVLRRKRGSGGGERLDAQLQAAITHTLVEGDPRLSPAEQVRAFSHELQVARLFGQARRDAQLEPLPLPPLPSPGGEA